MIVVIHIIQNDNVAFGHPFKRDIARKNTTRNTFIRIVVKEVDATHLLCDLRQVDAVTFRQQRPSVFEFRADQ